jgi:hypothetical protein
LKIENVKLKREGEKVRKHDSMKTRRRENERRRRGEGMRE